MSEQQSLLHWPPQVFHYFFFYSFNEHLVFAPDHGKNQRDVMLWKPIMWTVNLTIGISCIISNIVDSNFSRKVIKPKWQAMIPDLACCPSTGMHIYFHIYMRSSSPGVNWLGEHQNSRNHWKAAFKNYRKIQAGKEMKIWISWWYWEHKERKNKKCWTKYFTSSVKCFSMYKFL